MFSRDAAHIDKQVSLIKSWMSSLLFSFFALTSN